MDLNSQYDSCTLCPRSCMADRRTAGAKGFCGCGDTVMAARAALHQWEEPWISGIHGSGTVFFTGCTLRCCFCQNYPISHCYPVSPLRHLRPGSRKAQAFHPRGL